MTMLRILRARSSAWSRASDSISRTSRTACSRASFSACLRTISRACSCVRPETRWSSRRCSALSCSTSSIRAWISASRVWSCCIRRSTSSSVGRGSAPSARDVAPGAGPRTAARGPRPRQRCVAGEPRLWPPAKSSFCFAVASAISFSACSGPPRRPPQCSSDAGCWRPRSRSRSDDSHDDGNQYGFHRFTPPPFEEVGYAR